MFGFRGASSQTIGRLVVALASLVLATSIRSLEELSAEEVGGLGNSDAEALDQAWKKLTPEQREMIDEFKKAHELGEKKEAELTCDSIQQAMLGLLDKAKSDLHPSCAAGACNFTKLDVDEVVITQGEVTAFVAAADKRKCLPTVMASTELQQKLGDLLSIVPQFLDASGTQEGRDRAREAYLQLVSFQQGSLALADNLADRTLALGHNTEKDCPAPCGKCDTKGSAPFGFRCLLAREDRGRMPELAERHGVVCDPSKPRLVRWLRRYSHQRQCTVADWKQAALQNLHVSAMLACATFTMVSELNTNLTGDQRREAHGLCVKHEQGNVLTPGQQEQLEAYASRVDEVVAPRLKLAFSIVQVLGIASGLAGLRAASREDGAAQGLLEPEAYFAVFAQLLSAQGLVAREADIMMYAQQGVTHEAEILQSFEKEESYGLSAQSTFTEGVKPLILFSMTQREALSTQSVPSLGGVLLGYAGFFGAGITGMYLSFSWVSAASSIYYSASTLAGANQFLIGLIYGVFGLGFGGAIFLGMGALGATIFFRMIR